MILLDTNVLSELMRTEPAAAMVEWLDARPTERLFISAITRAEIELGIQLLPDGRRKQRLREAAERMFDEFPGRCLPFDPPAASRYAAMVARRIRSGRPISVEDAQIAAVAVANGLTLATRNVSDFEGIDGLEVVNPWGEEG